MKTSNLNQSSKTKPNDKTIKEFLLKKDSGSMTSPTLKKTLSQSKTSLKKSSDILPKTVKHLKNFKGASISPQKGESKDLKLKFVDTRSFDVEKFMKSHTEEVLRCKICDKLLSDALSCYKCNKSFCGLCIKKELEAHSKCPSCFNIVFPEMLTPVDIESQEFYKSKELLCPFDRCKQLLNLTNARSHIEECIFNKVSEEKKQHITKIISLENKTDPFLKTHMLDYLI